MSTKRVLVTRIDLFKISEPFIADQARAHSEYEPIFVGVNEMGPRPDWAETVLLSDRQKINRLLKDRTTTVIHAHFAIDGFLGMRLARLANAPLVNTLHGFDVTRTRAAFLKSGRPNLVKYALGQGILQRRASKFLAVSGAIRDAAVQAGFPAERTVVHHLGVPLDGDALGVDLSGDLRIVHVARLVEKKGTEYLLRAMRLVVNQHPGATLQIIGEGSLGSYLANVAENLDIGESVEFLGSMSHEETLKRISDSNALCLPSVKSVNGETEGLPITILEGARFGLPIVTTANGGISDFLATGVNGLQVLERDVDSLAEALLRLANEEELRITLGSSARRTVTERFDVNAQTRKLEAMMDGVL